jgi:sulfur relay protein TusB/DsrH
MAILHIIAQHLDAEALIKLVERSNSKDGYVFMDDGVYVQLGNGLQAFASRDVFLLADHVDERGLKAMSSDRVVRINMSGLVHLTAFYASSMSW